MPKDSSAGGCTTSRPQRMFQPERSFLCMTNLLYMTPTSYHSWSSFPHTSIRPLSSSARSPSAGWPVAVAEPARPLLSSACMFPYLLARASRTKSATFLERGCGVKDSNATRPLCAYAADLSWSIAAKLLLTHRRRLRMLKGDSCEKRDWAADRPLTMVCC